MVDNAQYEQMTTATGTTIVLPSDPIKAGATFKGWFTEKDGKGTQYTAESTVDKDLTLYAYFENQVRVSFLVKDDDGNVISEKSQYFIDLEAGDEITTLPDDPFIAGKTFDHWENETNGETVEVGYVVEESFNAVAVFKAIDTYELTVKYFYKNDAGERVDIGSQVYDLIENDFPYTVTAPGYTIAEEVTDEPTYYPSQPTITVEKDDFTNFKLVVDDEYVAADAQYKVGHYLKSLTGEGYDLIETVDKEGVKNSKVTPEINNYAYADYESRDTDVTITGNADQELKVYYTRKNFTLSYNVGGGDYIEAVTAPYGTSITLPTTATRSGYTFDGWYKDADCTVSAGSSLTLEENTTLYAKWNAAQVDYKIVYMIENADDDGYSYLKDVTRQAETDTIVTLTKAQADSYAPSDLDKQNFTFKDSTTETIKADGTTVVVVRYSRNVYTITWEGSGYELDWWGNAQWHTGRGRATLTAKYGANISAQWTATFNTPHPDWAWNFSRTNNDEKFTSLDIMPSGNKTVYHWYYSTDKTQVLNYWFENYDSTQTKTYGGRTYGLFKSVTVHYNYLYDTDYPDYAGYTKGGWVRSDGARQLTDSTPRGRMTADFYYNALQYPLTFYNYDGSLISTAQVTLNENIYSRITNAIPDAPMEGATWKGWYTDAEHQNPYTYSATTKMPTGLVLYGDFQLPTRTVTFDSQGGSSVDAQTDEYGFYATAPEDPVKENYTFQGWFTAADETGSPYDWNQPVTENITLYAHWTQKTISYTVHYYEQGTTTKVLEDKVVSDPSFTKDQEITENAPTVAGHISDKASETIKLTFDDAKNVITFYYYTVPDELTYTVNYVLKDHPEIKVAESKTVTVPGTTTNALELAVEVDDDYLATQTEDEAILSMHYKPVETSKELQLAREGNVITFEYVSYTTSKITVNYLDMDGKEIEDTDTSYVEKGDTFTLQNKAPDGYVYHHAYLDGTTTAPQPTYQITGDEGDLVINVYYQKKLIIIANNKSKAYDGTALISSGLGDATITGTLRGDTVTSVQFDGSQTDAGTSTTTPKNAQISKGNQAITDPETYYSIIYVPGSLTVKPVSVYISIAADQWNTHSGSTGGPNYYTGQTFNVGFTNPSKQQFNDDTSKSAYVSITSGQRTLFKEKYGDAIWNALHGTDGALISEKNAGTYTVTGAEQKAILAGVKVDDKNMMADPNYSITLYARDSFLTIEPLPITITTPSGNKTYDGTPLTKSEGATLDHSYWTANIGGTWTTADTAAPGGVTLGTGDKITFNVTGSQTAVGKSDNTYSIEWADDEVSGNYAITATLGTLEVTETNLTLTIKDKTVVYNGSEQSGYTVDGPITGTGSTIETEAYTVTGLASGDVLTVEGYQPAKGTNAQNDPYDNGSFDNATIKIMNGETDVTESYTITTQKGKLTINPAPIEIDTKDPDGDGDTSDAIVLKKVVGTGFEETEFAFTIEAAEGSPAPGATSGTVVATDEGSYAVDFGKITFKEAGTYTYNVQETAPETIPEGWTFDTEPKTVTITVAKSDDGSKLEAAVSGTTITNTYETDEITIDTSDAATGFATKTVSGTGFGSTTFNFTVEANNDAPKADRATASVTATAAGNYVINFGTITFTEEGDYTYTVTETGTAPAGWTFDTAPKTVTVEVRENEDGELEAKVTGISITNSYTSTPTPPPTPPTPPTPPEPPVVPVVVPDGPAPAAPVVVPDEPTPQVEPTTPEEIDNDPTPKTNTNTWALLNLILSAITVILAIVMIITFATGSKDDEDEENQDGENKKSRNGLKFLGLIPAIGTVVLFFLTEDMSAKMALTDKWTILTAVNEN